MQSQYNGANNASAETPEHNSSEIIDDQIQQSTKLTKTHISEKPEDKLQSKMKNRPQKLRLMVPQLSSLNRTELHERLISTEINLRTKSFSLTSTKNLISNLQLQIKEKNYSLQNEEFWRVATAERLKYYDSAIKILKSSYSKINEKMHLSESIRLELCENSKVLGLQNNGLEKENNECRTQLIAAIDECKELEAHVKDLSEKNSALTEIEKEHYNLGLLCNTLQNDIQKSKEAVKTKEQEYANEMLYKNKVIDQKNYEIVNLNTVVKELRVNIDTLLKEKIEYTALVEQLNNEIITQKQKIDTIHKGIEHDKLYNDDKFEKLIEKNDKLYKANAELNTAINNSEQLLAKLMDDYSISQQKNMEKSKRIEALKIFNCDITKELTNEITNSKNLKNSIKENQDKFLLEFNERNQLSNAVKELTEKINIKNKEYDDVMSDKISQDKIISKLQNEIEDMKKKVLDKPVTIPETSVELAEIDVDDLCNFDKMDEGITYNLSSSQASSRSVSSVYQPPKLTIAQRLNLEKAQKMRRAQMLNYGSDTSTDTDIRNKLNEKKKYPGRTPSYKVEDNRKFPPLFNEALTKDAKEGTSLFPGPQATRNLKKN